MDEIQLVRDAVASVRTNSPILLIGDAVVLFKKMYSGPIKVVANSEDVRELVTNYYGVESLSHPLIIEDLSSLTESASFLLLKLVEEARYPIILLSSFDKISSILLSRCKVILKFSLSVLQVQFLAPFRGWEVMNEYLAEGSDRMDRLRWMRDHSPLLYYYEEKTKHIPKKEKLLNILM